jgi:hypothetical protein
MDMGRKMILTYLLASRDVTLSGNKCQEWVEWGDTWVPRHRG